MQTTINQQIKKIERTCINKNTLPHISPKFQKVNATSVERIREVFEAELENPEFTTDSTFESRFSIRKASMLPPVTKLKLIPEFAEYISPILPASDKLCVQDFKVDLAKIIKSIKH